MKKKSRKASKKTLSIIMIAILAVLVAALAVYMALNDDGKGEAPVFGKEYEAKTSAGYKVVIDAGHGGFDPGTYGAGGTRECDINLLIAMKLKDAFLGSGADVVMTREADAALADEKDADMAARREIISTSGQDITISIHQNYFEDASVRGPQVFYAEGSEEGAKLAKCIQDAMNEELETESPRVEQGSNYYIVKSGAAPAVIVECGFLSNAEEEQLLNNGSYRLAIVRAIVKGTENYLADE